MRGAFLLRGVNVGGHNKLPMADLRSLCEGLGLRDVSTLIQSGNVVFTTGARNLDALAPKLSAAIENSFGFCPQVVARTESELKALVTRSQLAARPGVQYDRLVVMFLATTPGAAARRALAALKPHPEELSLEGREITMVFPNGISKSQLSMATIERAAGIPGTCRNWNTIQKLLALIGDTIPQRAGPLSVSPGSAPRITSRTIGRSARASSGRGPR